MTENKKILYIDMDGVLVDLKAEFDKWFELHPHLVDKYKKCPGNVWETYRRVCLFAVQFVQFRFHVGDPK